MCISVHCIEKEFNIWLLLVELVTVSIFIFTRAWLALVCHGTGGGVETEPRVRGPPVMVITAAL